jgi:GGDEF domain-containing protein
MVSLRMHILSTWAGNIIGPFAQFSTHPAATVRVPSDASNGWGAVRAIAGWLGLSATSPVRAKVCISTDQKSWGHDKDAMFKAGNEMLCRGRGSNQPLSVLVFDLSDLPELECVFGLQAAKDVIAQTAVRMQGLAGRTGLAVRTSATTFTVLLPGVDGDGALEVVRAALGQPCCIELVAGGEEMVLVPEWMVRTVLGDAGCVSQVYESLCRDIAQARLMEERRTKYLERERESHSRPMKSRSLPTRLPATRAGPRRAPRLDYPPMAATMPVPMGPR